MHKLFFTSLVVMGLSFSSTTFAQDTTEETVTEPTTKQAAEETNSAEDQAFPVAKDPKDQVGGEFVKEEHGDWKIICVNLGEDKKPNCRLYQLLTDKNGAAVAELSIVALEDAAQAAAGVNFVTPLGTLLTAQAGMQVDEGKVKLYPFSWCEQLGCVTRFGLTSGELESLKKGNKAIMSITAVAAPKAPISLDLSLSGFTAGWNALTTLGTE